ncbi:MAG: histidine kinase [Bacteroidetes bacterium]|nr:histidine kinase [Bacteroidota bacterium]
MQEPTILFYTILIACSLLLALIGLYILAAFSRLFRGRIRNEILRKNVVAWLAIFCISGALSPMSSGFFIIIAKHGYPGLIFYQLVSTTLNTLLVYNTARFVAEHKKIKALPQGKRMGYILSTIIITSLLVNVPFSMALFNFQKQFLKFVIISNIYITAITGLIYTVISYLDVERKRKFDEKELELSRLRELKTKAELDALHSKINPHFLYNALNSIADLSITDGKKARRMTIALADLFRYSINYSNNNFSSVKDEVEMANVYLQIEKIRFEDKLNYSMDVEEGLGHYLVPRFVLQPIVENAVKHGLKATGQLTQITVLVKRDQNGMVIHVQDTGPAFPDEMIPGYGVKSVYDKLDLLFPGHYEMHFTNEPVKQVSLYINKLVKDESAI